MAAIIMRNVVAKRDGPPMGIPKTNGRVCEP